MKKPLRIIHVEDSLPDCELVRRMLENDGLACDIQRVVSRTELEKALHDPTCDLILSDCSLPQFHGLEALEMARTSRPEVPFIFVSGTIGEETAIMSLQTGATDYVLKHRLTRLVPAVRRALAEAETLACRRALAAQLRQARKLESIGTLAGGLAHDFKNMLQVLKMSLSLLRLKSQDPIQVDRLAQQMEKVTDQGCELMQELLDFAHQTEAKLVPLDAAKQIESLAATLRPSLPDSIALNLHLSPGLPPISADEGKLDRILTNLILNARDAMPTGGRIGVRTDVIRFHLTVTEAWQIQNSPYLRIRVFDNGTGMDEKTQARIFEPFFTTKPHGKGTGLGLAVVFGLMEAHRGFIDLASQPGAGTTFSLFFPLTPNAAVPAGVETILPNRLLGQVAVKPRGNGARLAEDEDPKPPKARTQPLKLEPRWNRGGLGPILRQPVAGNPPPA